MRLIRCSMRSALLHAFRIPRRGVHVAPSASSPARQHSANITHVRSNSAARIHRERVEVCVDPTYGRVMSRTEKATNLVGVVVPFLGVLVAVVLLWQRWVDVIDLLLLAGLY